MSQFEVAAKWDEVWEWGSPTRPDFESWGSAETQKAAALRMLEIAGAARSTGD